MHSHGQALDLWNPDKLRFETSSATFHMWPWVRYLNFLPTNSSCLKWATLGTYFKYSNEDQM